MHLVTRSYLDAFCRDFGAPFDFSKNFEAFGNYCVFSKYSGDSVEVSDFVYDGADPGIDGAFLFLDDRAIFSPEELSEILRAVEENTLSQLYLHKSSLQRLGSRWRLTPSSLQ